METVMNSPVATAFAAYQDRVGMKIKPDKDFYLRVGINRKRFAQLLRGEKSPTANEIKELAKFFQVNFTDLI